MNKDDVLSYSRKSSDFCFSGWIASILGVYLFATGAFNLIRLIIKTDSGDEILGVFPELVSESSPVARDKLSFIVLLSYLAGIPMFAGSALMSLGSLARSAKGMSTQRVKEVRLGPENWIAGSDEPKEPPLSGKLSPL
jgi:hypothetical protein